MLPSESEANTNNSTANKNKTTVAVPRGSRGARAWQFYSPISGRAFARCLQCKGEVPVTDGNTTGLVKHLERHHSETATKLHDLMDKDATMKAPTPSVLEEAERQAMFNLTGATVTKQWDADGKQAKAANDAVSILCLSVSSVSVCFHFPPILFFYFRNILP